MTDAFSIIQTLLLIIQVVVLLGVQISLSSINAALDDILYDDGDVAAVRLDPSRDDIF